MVFLTVVAHEYHLAVALVLGRDAHPRVLLYAVHPDALALPIVKFVVGLVGNARDAGRGLIQRHGYGVEDDRFARTGIARYQEDAGRLTRHGVVQSVLQIDVCLSIDAMFLIDILSTP